jgi:hypothetical protein
MVKAVLFLPQFVVVLAFPSMSNAAAARATLFKSLLVVVLLGTLTSLGAWLLSGLAVIFVGGDEYSSLQDDLWIFAGLGTVLAMVQLLIYSVLARQARRAVLLVYAALAAVVAVGQSADSVTGLMVLVLTVDLALLASLVVVALRHSNPGRIGPDPFSVPAPGQPAGPMGV